MPAESVAPAPVPAERVAPAMVPVPASLQVGESSALLEGEPTQEPTHAHALAP
jgi:hypothetical protein